MEIIVLTEVHKEMGADFGPGDAVTHPTAVHAAPADPDIPGDPGERTFCGKPTTQMEPHSYSPPGPGAPWYPSNLSGFRCATCNAALRSL